MVKDYSMFLFYVRNLCECFSKTASRFRHNIDFSKRMACDFVSTNCDVLSQETVAKLNEKDGCCVLRRESKVYNGRPPFEHVERPRDYFEFVPEYENAFKGILFVCLSFILFSCQDKLRSKGIILPQLDKDVDFLNEKLCLVLKTFSHLDILSVDQQNKQKQSRKKAEEMLSEIFARYKAADISDAINLNKPTDNALLDLVMSGQRGSYLYRLKILDDLVSRNVVELPMEIKGLLRTSLGKTFIDSRTLKAYLEAKFWYRIANRVNEMKKAM